MNMGFLGSMLGGAGGGLGGMLGGMAGGGQGQGQGGLGPQGMRWPSYQQGLPQGQQQGTNPYLQQGTGRPQTQGGGFGGPMAQFGMQRPQMGQNPWASRREGPQMAAPPQQGGGQPMQYGQGGGMNPMMAQLMNRGMRGGRGF